MSRVQKKKARLPGERALKEGGGEGVCSDDEDGNPTDHPS